MALYSLLLIVLMIIYFPQLDMQLGHQNTLEAQQLCQSCTLPDWRLLWIFSLWPVCFVSAPTLTKATVYFISLATKACDQSFIIYNDANGLGPIKTDIWITQGLSWTSR